MLDEASRRAFDIAFENIRAFHVAQQSEPLSVETMPGVVCRRVTRPISAPPCRVAAPLAVPPAVPHTADRIQSLSFFLERS